MQKKLQSLVAVFCLRLYPKRLECLWICQELVYPETLLLLHRGFLRRTGEMSAAQKSDHNETSTAMNWQSEASEGSSCF